MGSNRRPRSSRPGREKRIPGSYIVILQPGVTPYDLLSTVLEGHKPTFTYGSIFNGFAVDRVSNEVAHEVRLDPRVLKVVENRVVSSLNKELLIETLQTKYTVVNRDTGELYDVREIDASMPYRYSVLPHGVDVPSKARRLLGINEHTTHVPPKAARVMGHNPYRQRVTEREMNGPVSDKAAKMLGLAPVRRSSSGPVGNNGGGGSRQGSQRRASTGGNSGSWRGGRAAMEEEEAMERGDEPYHVHSGNYNAGGELAGGFSDDDEVLFDAEEPSPYSTRKASKTAAKGAAATAYDQESDSALPHRSWRRQGSQ